MGPLACWDPLPLPLSTPLPPRDADRRGRAGALRHKQWGLWYVVPCSVLRGPRDPRTAAGVTEPMGAGGASWGHTGNRSPTLEGLGRTGSSVPTQPLWPPTGEEYRPLLPSRETSLRILTTALSPLDYRKWRRKPWYWRLFKAFKVSSGDTSQEEPPKGHPCPCWPLGLCLPGDGGTGAVGLGAGHGAPRRVSQMGVPRPRCLWSWCCCSLFLLWTPTRMT